MKSIALICPYFGRFPENIDLTFYSMSKNNSIDWYIFTDDMKWFGKYENIHFVNMTFEYFQDIVYKKIGTKVSSPYKICDYKPSFGYLFSEYIEKYDFWGYCDLDVIFGDLRKFITEDKLDKYDKIYELGHLSIFKNTDNIRKAFMGNNDCIVNFKDILNQKEILVFDEPYCLYFDPVKKVKTGGINQILIKQGYLVYDNKEDIADLDVKYKNFFMMHWNNQFRCNNVYFVYNNGKVYQHILEDELYLREVAYVHFQQKKDIPIKIDSYDYFAATPKGFIDVNKVNKVH